MTCLNEDDGKNEAFSTRIGRSFTFQKRSDQESEIRRQRGAAAASGPPLGKFLEKKEDNDVIMVKIK